MKKIMLFALLISLTIELSAQKENSGLSQSGQVKNGEVYLVYIDKAASIFDFLEERNNLLNYDPSSFLLQIIFSADIETYPDAQVISAQSLNTGASWMKKTLLGYGQANTLHPQAYIFNSEQHSNPMEVIIGSMSPVSTIGSWSNRYFYSGLNTDPFVAHFDSVAPSCPGEFFRYGTDVTDDGYVYGISECIECDSSGYTQYNINTYRGEPVNGDHIEFGSTNAGSIDVLEATIFCNLKFSTAWSQDGSIGYIFGTGILNAFAGQSGINPIVWKSTDHGATWTIITEGMNMVDFPGLEDVLVMSDDGHYIPLFKDDITGTIDANGDLQFFGRCISGISLGSGKYNFPANDDEKDKLMNVTINPETGITGFHYITDLLSRDVTNDSEYAYATSSDGKGWNHRIQTSRSLDGMNYFVIWGDTPDADEMYNGENAHPDLFVWGHSIDPDYANLNNPVLQLTDEGHYWFHYVSTRVLPIEGTIFKIPVTKTLSSLEMLSNLDWDPVTIFFVNGLMYDVSVGIEESIKETKIEVSQNQPNPFSGISTISVTLDRKAGLSLEVYNTLGQRVYSMEKGVVSAGSYDFRLDAGNFTPGVYYYMVKAGEAKVCKKMIVK